MYIIIYKEKNYRYLKTIGKFMHAYGVSPTPPRRMCSIQDTTCHKPHYKDRLFSQPLSEQVLPSPHKDQNIPYFGSPV